ncbi:hypothetical protein ACFLW6_04730 [Chloroflexota bacterium]
MVEMNRRFKWYLLLYLVIALLILLPACGSKATLINQQVVVIISVSAAPAIDRYLEQNGQTPLKSLVAASGDWDAVYAGDGIWRVNGTVTVGYPNPEKNCSTTWTFNEVDGTTKLITLNCK